MWSLVIAKDLFSQFDATNLLAPTVAREVPQRGARARRLEARGGARRRTSSAGRSTSRRGRTWLNREERSRPEGGTALASEVPRFKLTIEYAGTRYSGWQIQKNAGPSRARSIAPSATVTGRKDFELYGSGRTDAGVHALAQVAHLDVARALPPRRCAAALNDELPADINILAADAVPHRFHARHDAVARRYLYQIARRRTAFAKPFVWWVKEPLDVDRMRAAAAAFVGMQDFQSFAASDDARRPPQVDARARRSRSTSSRTATWCSSRSKDRISSGRWSAASSACSSKSAAAGSSRRPRRRFSPSRPRRRRG